MGGRKGGERKHRRERETLVASCTLAHNPGMCPEWELSCRPLGSQADVQSTEPPSQGDSCFVLPGPLQVRQWTWVWAPSSRSAGLRWLLPQL